MSFGLLRDPPESSYPRTGRLNLGAIAPFLNDSKHPNVNELPDRVGSSHG
jgi:hypothetical protein